MTTITGTSPIRITRHDVPDAMVCTLGPDKFRLEEILKAECGEVSGSIWRHIDDETEDGCREVVFEVRLTGSHETGGFSDWCACTPANLGELVLVTQALKTEWEALR